MIPFIDTIQKGDSFELVKQIPDNSIDLILTDPPYFINGESGYQDVKWDSVRSIIPEEYHLSAKSFPSLPKKERKKIAKEAIDQYFRRVINVFTPKLSIAGVFVCFNRSDNLAIMKSELRKQTLTKKEYSVMKEIKNYPLLSHKRWIIDQDIEWLKLGPSPTVSEINKQEYALVAFNSYGVIKNPTAYQPRSQGQYETGTTNQYVAHSPFNEYTEYGENTGHLTPKPFTLWRDLIRRFSNPGDTVFDPFSGSGTTALASYDMNRHFIAFESDEEQVLMSRDRLEIFKMIMPRSAFPTKLGVLPQGYTQRKRKD